MALREGERERERERETVKENKINLEIKFIMVTVFFFMKAKYCIFTSGYQDRQNWQTSVM